MMVWATGGGHMSEASATARRDGIGARLASLPARIEADASMLRRGRWLNATCQLDIGGDMYLLRIVDGRLAELRSGPFVTPSADFAIFGNAAVWRRFLATDPPPGDHDLFAFLKRKELRVAGDLHPLMSHLLYWKALFAHLREDPR
jgi:hypothetical protein